MMRVLCLVFSLGFAVSNSAAAQVSVDHLGSSPEKIQGGVPDHQSAPVGMLLARWKEDGVSVFGFCTGTLVAPQVVLTAGHCVSEYPVEAFFLGDGAPVSLVQLDADLFDPVELGMVRIPVDDQLAFPTFEMKEVCPSKTPDVGLVHLARPVENIAPAKIDFSLPQVGNVCQAVGYGEHENEDGEVTFGQKRIGDDEVKGFGPLSIRVMYLTGLADQGDSGGPLFCNGTVRGLCSCGYQSWFDGKNVFYSRMDTVAEWMNAVMDDWR